MTEPNIETTFVIYFNANRCYTIKRLLNDICDACWNLIYCVIREPKIPDTIKTLSKNNYLTSENKMQIEHAIQNPEFA